MTKTQMYCTVNHTPIGPVANESNLYMLNSRGFEPLVLATAGMFNRYENWYANSEMLPHDRFPAWKDENYSHPPQQGAAEAIAKLAQQANFYHKGIKTHLPVMYNLEKPTFHNDPLKVREVYRHAVNLMTWAKLVNTVSEISFYFFPQQYPAAQASDALMQTQEVQQFILLTDWAVMSAYNINWHYTAPLSWYGDVRRWARMLNRYCPDLPKIACVQHVYEEYWTSTMGITGKYVGKARFTDQCKYLIEVIGVAGLYLFTGDVYSALTPELREAIDVMNTLQLQLS